MVARIKAIVPNTPNFAPLFNLLDGVIRETITDANKDFDKTTATSSKKPKFKQEFNFGGKTKSGKVSTKDENYSRLNFGTRPHKIRARRKPLLVFRLHSTPKTRPGFLGSFPGSRSGPLIFAKEVNHPGFKARGLDKAVKKNQEPLFFLRANEALEEGAKLSGHGL